MALTPVMEKFLVLSVIALVLLIIFSTGPNQEETPITPPQKRLTTSFCQENEDTNQNFQRVFASIGNNREGLEMLKEHKEKPAGIFIDYLYIREDGTVEIKTDLSLEIREGFPGKEVYAIASNYEEEYGGFCDYIAQSVISSWSSRNEVTENIVEKIEEYGFDGLLLDIEFNSYDQTEKEKFSELVAQLREALNESGKKFFVAVPARVSYEPNTWAWHFDYSEISENCDAILIMAYDKDIKPSNPGGPIAPVEWVGRVLDFAINSELVESEKIMLGIAAYGRDWYYSEEWESDYLSFEKIQEFEWEFGESEFVMEYEGEIACEKRLSFDNNGIFHDIFFHDRNAMLARMRLAKEYNIDNFFICCYGSEDPSYWEKI